MEQQIQRLGEDMRQIQDLLVMTSQTVMDQDVSSFPIFVVYQRAEAPELGIPIADEASNPGSWVVNISTLEEFVARQLISDERIENFKAVFKDPRVYFCLFLIEAGQANFIFLPVQKIG